MTRRLHQLRLHHGERELTRHTTIAVLDLDDVDSAADLLNGHLVGAAIRAGAGRFTVHEYVLEVFDVDSAGRTKADPRLRWAFPADPQVVDQ